MTNLAKYAVVLMLSGCAERMDNDTIISEAKKCTDAGMDARLLFRGFDFVASDLLCVPRADGG